MRSTTMDTPWQVLTLDPATASERDVKAAYARLLKQHRPDADPEGFQRVREAYEAALVSVRNRLVPVHDEPADAYAPPRASTAQPPSAGGIDLSKRGEPSSPAPEREPPRTAVAPQQRSAVAAPPQALAELLTGIDIALNNVDTQQAMAAAMAKFCTEAMRTQQPTFLVSAWLRDTLKGDAHLLAKHAPADFLLHMLAGGECDLLMEVVKAWDHHKATASAAMLAMAIEREKYQPADEDTAMVLAHVARLIAFYHPGSANHLANISFGLLPREGREQIIGFLEHQVSMGRLFFGFPPEMLRFWQQRLQADREQGYDWGCDEARAAVRYVVQNRGYSWEGLGVMQQLTPEHVWSGMEHELRAQVDRQRQAQGGLDPAGKVVATVLCVMVVLGLLLGLTGSNDEDRGEPRRSRSVPPPSLRRPPDNTTSWYNQNANRLHPTPGNPQPGTLDAEVRRIAGNDDPHRLSPSAERYFFSNPQPSTSAQPNPSASAPPQPAKPTGTMTLPLVKPTLVPIQQPEQPTLKLQPGIQLVPGASPFSSPAGGAAPSLTIPGQGGPPLIIPPSKP